MEMFLNTERKDIEEEATTKKKRNDLFSGSIKVCPFRETNKKKFLNFSQKKKTFLAFFIAGYLVKIKNEKKSPTKDDYKTQKYNFSLILFILCSFIKHSPLDYNVE